MEVGSKKYSKIFAWYRKKIKVSVNITFLKVKKACGNHYNNRMSLKIPNKK